MQEKDLNQIKETQLKNSFIAEIKPSDDIFQNIENLDIENA